MIMCGDGRTKRRKRAQRLQICCTWRCKYFDKYPKTFFILSRRAPFSLSLTLLEGPWKEERQPKIAVYIKFHATGSDATTAQNTITLVCNILVGRERRMKFWLQKKLNVIRRNDSSLSGGRRAERPKSSSLSSFIVHDRMQLTVYMKVNFVWCFLLSIRFDVRFLKGERWFTDSLQRRSSIVHNVISRRFTEGNVSDKEVLLITHKVLSFGRVVFALCNLIAVLERSHLPFM